MAGDPIIPTLNVYLLGGFRLTSDQQPVVSLTTERAQALLAYLLLHRHTPQSRQRLAFRFWADLSEAHARANLRKALHHLRYGLPYADRYLMADAKTLQWNVNALFTLDVAEFEAAITLAATQPNPEAKRSALETAANLYQGDLLAGFTDEWIVPERERLQQTWLMGLEHLAQVLEQQQDYRTAIHYIQQRLEVDTLHEATYCSLMRLHYLNGDRASALRVYHRCMTLLREELGIDPSLNTRELYERLLQDEQTSIN